MTFKRVLCAVDFSRPSVEAFRAAAELARQSRASLYVLHVMQAQPVVQEWPPTERLGEAVLRTVEMANAALQELVDSAESTLQGVPVTTEVTSGEAFEEIVNRAREWRADLVILGSKGVARLEKIVIGSTAENVTKSASCSVLVVRSSKP